MLHCPYCGSSVNDNESFCVTCGKKLPEDITHRILPNRKFNKLWIVPISVLVLFLLSSAIYYVYLENRSTKAIDLYNEAEEKVLSGEYTAAEQLFEEALHLKSNFPQGDISLLFTKRALGVQSTLTEAEDHRLDNNYEEALSIINDAENNIQNFYGLAVSDMISKIISQRNDVKIDQLEEVLHNDPSIDDLKILLWEADAIDEEHAEDIAHSIRSQIIDYTFSRASEQLNEKHFNDALLLVEDGLKYAPDSEKLQSLETTINNEQASFESAQEERLEQAMNTALEEREMNELDAVELLEMTLENDEQDNIIVKGEVKSVATVPINSIIVDYSLLNKDETEFVSNEVFVYPDRLYPDEKGNFEFTHFDIDENRQNLQIEINKITWYTD
ncbi:zinc ribbon domain-containing protein [Virgibacillus oceani]